MKEISRIAAGIVPSATMAIDSLAKQMRAEGIDVIGFGAGEPDFNTPEYIKEAGIKAIRENKTRYTPASGIMELKEAICKWLEREMHLSYKPNQICISSGAKHIVYLALQIICNPGDEIILPAPYWVTYAEAIKMTGATPVIVNTTEENNFKMRPQDFEQAITPKTKGFILTNPSNPTGLIYNREELEAIAKIVQKHDLYVISDEIYSSLIYKGEFVSFASLGDAIRDRTILINGASKTFAMTGWRIGYAASNEKIAKSMSSYLSHSTGSPCSISQYASVAAYSADSTATEKMREEYDRRRKYFVSRVNQIDGVSCIEPEGAFYVFMNIKKQIGRTIQGYQIHNSSEFADALLRKANVAVVPGSAFGMEGYIRWSYATSMEHIIEGLNRLEKFLKG